MFALAGPIVSLLFQHGAFSVSDQHTTALALLFYAPGLPFSAIDQVLIFAFYARKNTLTPVMVGIAQVAVYLTVALGTYKTIGMIGLVLANSLQVAFHATVTGLLLWRVLRREGGMHDFGVGSTAAKAGGAALVMALVCYATWSVLSTFISPEPLVNRIILVGVPALVGGALYAGLVWLMRLPELQLIKSKVLGRLKR